MKPSDNRDATWRDVERWVSRQRREVYQRFQALGPATTKALAEATGMSLLTLRPRTTELCQVGLLECVGKESDNGHEGIYRAVPEEQAAAAWERARAASRTEQLTLL